MRSHLKVQTVNRISIVCCLLPQNRLHRMLYPLSIFIALIAALLGGTGYDILPQSLELRIGQRVSIPPSLLPDLELRKYHCPCLALTPPPVAIRHLLLRNRYRPDGLHGVQSKARPNRNVPEE